MKSSGSLVWTNAVRGQGALPDRSPDEIHGGGSTDATTAHGVSVFHMISVFAEFERDHVSARACEGHARRGERRGVWKESRLRRTGSARRAARIAPRSTFQPRSAPMTRGWLSSFRLHVSRRIGLARKRTNRWRLEDRPPTRLFSEWRLERKPVILAAA